jgi:hypothetical protein
LPRNDENCSREGDDQEDNNHLDFNEIEMAYARDEE